MMKSERGDIERGKLIKDEKKKTNWKKVLTI